MSNTLLWIVQGIVAAVFLMAGATKIAKSKEELGKKMAWVENFSPATLRFIGAAELAGALGLILPQLTGIQPALTIWAGYGLVAVMVGAIATHIHRKEYSMIGINIVLLAGALFVSIGRS